MGDMVGCASWWCGRVSTKTALSFDYILFAVFLSHSFISGSQSISTVATHKLKIVERVPLLANELKGNH